MKDEIKNRLNMNDVLEFYGIKKHRHNYLCPFHKDKHASMSIKYNHYNCFACGSKGDVIQFVMNYFNLDFVSAMNKINIDFNLFIKTKQQYNDFDRLRFKINKINKQIYELEEKESYLYLKEYFENSDHSKSQFIRKNIKNLELYKSKLMNCLLKKEEELNVFLEFSKLHYIKKERVEL